MESWCVQPGLVEPPLLWLRWCARSPRRLNRPRPRRLSRRRAAGDRPARGPRGAGGPRARRGLSLRVRLSSSVVCRLPAELLRLASRDVSLPVACGEATGDGGRPGSPGLAPPAAVPSSDTEARAAPPIPQTLPSESTQGPTAPQHLCHASTHPASAGSDGGPHSWALHPTRLPGPQEAARVMLLQQSAPGLRAAPTWDLTSHQPPLGSSCPRPQDPPQPLPQLRLRPLLGKLFPR